MQRPRSEFGQHLCGGSGIGELMDDLGAALAAGGDKIRMLGGGQPSHIPEIDQIWRDRVEQLLHDGGMDRALGNYEPPAGNHQFRKSIAELFRRKFEWDLGPENVAVTAGGQTALFMIFNSLAGRFEGGTRKRVLLPLIPEYIGYANQSVGGELFRAVRPRIESIGDHEFKYRVDFNSIEVADDIAAICVSRPTNPTGNVLTDEEVTRLAALADQHEIPLIIDNAYGAPFPNAIFVDATPFWNPNTILTLSLSKLGLPGTRTGIVVADPETIRGISSMTSIVGLSNTNIGQAITLPMIESGEVLKVSNEIVRPYYEQKSAHAQRMVSEFFPDNVSYRVHRSEGAFFLWMWFPDLPITSRELYERLKLRDVLVVPGNYFFFGDEDGVWEHRNQCIRVSFTMDEATVADGIRIIADEVRNACDD